MAWIDDRIWCHPKFTGLTDAQFAAYIKGVAYSAGMGTRGLLTSDQQRLMFVHPRTRVALVNAGLWDAAGSAGDIRIHDWDEHNGKRDERRAKDRERKRVYRRQSTGRPQDSPQDVPKTSKSKSAGTAHVDGSEGSEGKNPTHQPELQDVAGGASENGTDLTPLGPELEAALNKLQATT